VDAGANCHAMADQPAFARALSRRNHARTYAKSGGLLVTLADEPIFAATAPNKIQAYMA
jgi:hypothetical protein